MTIPDLIRMAQSKISNLGSLRTSAERIGDVEQVIQIDKDIVETQNTLNVLQSLT
jgi:hypothetical protein